MRKNIFKKHLIIYKLVLVVPFLLCYCTSKPANDPPKKEWVNTQKAQKLNNLSLFSNTKGYLFCVYLPLNEYKIDEKSIYESYNKNVEMDFLPAKNPDTDEKITLQCFKNENNKALIYYRNKDIESLKKESFIIENDQLDAEFYRIDGFHPYQSEYKFVSLVWVKNLVYRFDLIYLKKDSAIWNERLITIAEEGMKCN
jgi:hypothetical protein